MRYTPRPSLGVMWSGAVRRRGCCWRARRAGLERMRVLAAMCGGVDSAVAAARARTPVTRSPASTWRCAEPGSPPLRSAGLLHAGGRQGRPAGGGRDRDPFLRMGYGGAVRRRRGRRLRAEYARGRTPNPCLRCNEKIKFAAVLDRALALDFDAVVTGHHARLEQTAGLRRSADIAKDQSYVLAMLAASSWPGDFPLGDSTKAQVRAEAAARGLAVAAKPDSTTSASSRGDTRGLATGAPRRAARPGRGRRAGAVIGSHDGAYGFTSASAAAWHQRPGRRRPAALRPGRRARELGHGDRRARRVTGRDRDPGRAPGLDRLRPASGSAGLPGAVAGARAGASRPP